jgi:hypothetical protein
MKRSKCTTSGNSAKTYADANAKDGLTAIDWICGTDPGLSSCGAGGGAGGLTDCIGTRPNTGNYVEVHTKTEVKSGDYLLPFSFAQTLTGVADGKTVHACARVGWGSPNGGLAITFSVCDYDDALSSSHIVTGTPTAADDTILYIHGKANKCKSGPSGSNLDGGFGWTDDDANCLTTIGSNGTYGSETGVGLPKECKDALAALRASKTPVAIPIFNDLSAKGGSKGTYTLKGFAAFVITGWSLTGKDQPSWLNSGLSCKGSYDCITGYFTNAVVDWDGSFGTTPVMGAVVIKTVG